MRGRLAGLTLLTLFAIGWASSALAAATEDVLKLVPDGALGVVVVNRPGAVDGKIQDLGRQMQLPVPSLLMLLDLQVNFRKGFDQDGSLAVIVLPAQQGRAFPTPILLVPVSDYEKFLGQFEPEEAKDGLTRITLKGVSGWARQIGGYAAVTDGSYREVLEKTLKVSKELPAGLAAWRPWLADQDLAAVVLQPGVQELCTKAQEGIRQIKETMTRIGQSAPDSSPQGAKLAENMEQMARIWDFYASIFQAAQKQVSACGFGVQVDKQSSLRLTGRTMLVSSGSWAKRVEELKPTEDDLLAGIPDKPFVIAGSGAASEAVWKGLMAASFKMMKSMREFYGLSEEQLDKMIQMADQSMKGIRGMSMVLSSGHSGESIYSGMAGVFGVDDSQEFLASYEAYVRQYSELLKGVKHSALPQMDVQKSQIDGHAGLKLTMNALKPPKDFQTPDYDRMMKALLGPDQKAVGWLVAVDKHRILMSYADKNVLQQMLKDMGQSKPGLAGDAELKKTAALLPPKPVVTVYVSPRGAIEFVQRIVPAFAPPEANVNLKLPEFPKTPPLGFAVTTGKAEAQMQLVVPREVIQAVGHYVGQVLQKANQADEPAESK